MPKSKHLQNAQFIWPGTGVGSLVFGAIYRNTHGLNLSHQQRHNFFPASPLCTITVVWAGKLFRVDQAGSNKSTPLSAIFVTGPTTLPFASWSTGEVQAMTVCFYPDAWLQLTGQSAECMVDCIQIAQNILPASLMSDLQQMYVEPNHLVGFENFQIRLEQYLQHQDRDAATPHRLVKNWVASLIAKTAMSETGKSARQIQRRIKLWSGQSKQTLKKHMRLEDLFARTRTTAANENLAELSHEFGYCDQSHMGREVRRLTGFSPARINRLIDTDERFWCYKLLGELY